MTAKESTVLDGGAIRWEMAEDGILELVLDDPGRSANTMSEAYVASMEAAVDRLGSEAESISGVIITSAKETFFAGADLDWLHGAGRDQVPEVIDLLGRIKSQLRRLETCGVPVVAAIGGAALGGGLEIALAAHRRIAVRDPRARIGFPEVGLGLIPGGGGVVRTVRMLGIVESLSKVLLEGKRFTPEQALELGLVDELVDDREGLLPAARRWIAGSPVTEQPWDRDGYSIPGGTPDTPDLQQTLPAIPANIRKQLHGANYPAPVAIASAVVEGAQVDIDNALAIEGRWFAHVATGQVAKSMTKAFFYDMAVVTGDRAAAGGERPELPSKAVVLGGGMMGSGIAYVCARAGLEVVIKDVDAGAAERGRDYSRKQVERAVERGRMSSEEAERILSRIRSTDDPAEADGAGLLIEAVFEDRGIKDEALREIEPHLAEGALLGSNTSTLPISGLAGSITVPDRFIGLHFFSPAERMPLLEIIQGEETDPATTRRALALAGALGKTPIVVNDSPGFFTSRVIEARLNEGLAMVAEGIPAATIEQASLQAGYPAPILQLSDELNLELMKQIRDAARGSAEAEGRPWEPHPAEEVIDRMVDELGRPGRAAGAGFYEYEGGTRQGLWSGLAPAFGESVHGSDLARDLEGAGRLVSELRDRLLLIESLEAVKCHEEGVIESIPDANVGSILGIGYPGWTGGVLQFVDGQKGGPAGYVEELRRLASRHGDRFQPTEGLLRLAESGERYAEAAESGVRA